MMMRLNKYLASCGIGSRRACDAFIIEGCVRVNGDIVKELGVQIDPLKDIVLYDGKKVTQEIKRYFLFYKPVGVLTTHDDPFERADLSSFLKEEKERLFSIGRLDADSEGLLILTNDGEIAHHLQHPKYKIPKVYYVWTNKELSHKEQKKFEDGILLEEGMTSPAKIKRIAPKEYKIILKQGWKRQIRRMLGSLGTEVLRLKRLAIGNFELGTLQPGEKMEISSSFFKQKIKKS